MFLAFCYSARVGKGTIRKLKGLIARAEKGLIAEAKRVLFPYESCYGQWGKAL